VLSETLEKKGIKKFCTFFLQILAEHFFRDPDQPEFFTLFRQNLENKSSRF